MISRNDLCWCGSLKKWKKCHYPKVENSLKDRYLKQYGIIIKTPEQVKKIRKACKLAASILKKVCQIAKVGVTTQELDDYAKELHEKANAIPAPYHYGSPPFPKNICTSINEVICHGIPDKTILKDGDIVNIDVTCILDGYYGDCSNMVLIGNVDEDKKRVVNTSYECLHKAIEICKPGVKICEIGNVIEDIAAKNKCSVVNQFVGHGVGVNFHEPPQIPHHYNNMQIKLVPNMTFTIEPMINLGVKEAIIDPYDHWTARTKDNKASAQFEHTLLITQTSCEILTL